MMSDIQFIMKFELLPNEMLMECFQYLNTFEIFYSFDQLNNRFDSVIYNIPLCIHFQDVNKLMFDQFCKKLLSNSEIKNQIYSLKILNKDECFQAKIFLSFCSLNELSSLEKFQLMVPMKLFDSPPMYGEESDPGFYLNIKLTDLLLCQLRTLTIPYVCQSVLDTHQTSSIINLTISQCNSHDFYYLLKHFSKLKYLHINSVKYTFFNDTDRYSNDQYGIHLQQLIIDEFNDEFKNFEIFIKQTKNLKILTISNSIYDDMIDACRWEHLITSSLPYLNIFKFKFNYSLHRNQSNIIIDKFKQFQTDFWQEKHHWYSEYVIQDRSTFIHTIPYPLNIYQLEQDEIRHSNNSLNNINKFVNVTDLKIYPSVLTENYQYYFSNVTSITLCARRFGSHPTTKYIEYLKQIVNLSNLKHLDTMSNLKIESSSVFLELLKETSQLSSMIINGKNLQSCFQNDELCKYLNKMIRILHVHDSYISLWKYVKLNKFCQIFSNLEHLKCSIDHESNLLFLLEHLPKLYDPYSDTDKRKRPQVEGFSSGARAAEHSIWHGFKDGFTGLVNKPRTGYQRHGVLGGAAGAAVAIPNIVIKPVVGTLASLTWLGRGIYAEAKHYTHQKSSNLDNRLSVLSLAGGHRRSSSSSIIMTEDTLPEERGSFESGLEIDICKQILTDFERIKHEHSSKSSSPTNDNDNSKEQKTEAKLNNAFQRQRSHSATPL